MCDTSLSQERVRSSLWLCVRSVRHMTEQLVNIISSLGEGDCGHRIGVPRLRPLTPPTTEQSNSSDYSSSLCEGCDCASDCYRFKSIPRKCIEKEDSNRESSVNLNKTSQSKLSLTDKNIVHSQQLEIASQTTTKPVEDKQSYTTPDIATQTQQKVTSVVPDTPSEMMQSGTQMKHDERSSYFPHGNTWEQLIRSQIEETIARKISEKISQNFDDSAKDKPLENIKTANAHFLGSMNYSKSNDKLFIIEKEKKLTTDEIPAQRSLKSLQEPQKLSDKNRLASAGSINFLYSHDPDSAEVIVNKPGKLSKISSIRSMNSIIYDEIPKKEVSKVQSNTSVDQQQENTNTYLNRNSSQKYSGHFKEIITHNDPYLLNDVKLIQNPSRSCYRMKNHKTEKESQIEDSSYKNERSTNTLTSETVPSVKIQLDRGYVNRGSNSKDTFGTDLFNTEKNSDEFSIFDDFDYVSEVELLSLSSSGMDTVEVFGFDSEISVYNPDLSHESENAFLKLNEKCNFNKEISKKSDDTILSSKMSESSSELSAFSDTISKKTFTSTLLTLHNKGDHFDTPSSKSNASLTLNLSEASKYINNMKSINTESSSMKEKSVQYKSISVTNLERNCSNRSPEIIISRSVLQLSSPSDLSSSCFKDVSPVKSKKLTTKRFQNIEGYLKNIERHTTKDMDQNYPKFVNVFNKHFVPQSKQIHSRNDHLNRNDHNSVGNIVEDEIVIQTVDQSNSSDSLKESTSDEFANVKVIDISFPSRKSNHSDSLSSNSSHSLYCDVQNNEGSCESDKNVKDKDLSALQTSKSETIFLQATLEINNGNVTKTDSKLFKIHFDKDHFSIEDDDTVMEKLPLPSTKELDNLVSCFDTVCNYKYNPVKKRKKRNFNFNNHRNSKIIKGSYDKRKNRKNAIQCSFVECYLDDSESYSSYGKTGEHGSVIEVDKIDYYKT